MDINLLSKMVKELILDNDRVVLPGLGCFVAEIVPSTFSDKGYTINPPYRRLYFRAKPDQDDALIRFYAASNNIEMELAGKIINDFIAEMKPVLYSKKNIVFPGLGRLRATKENAVFFVADEDLDIYPDGFGLEPVSLKTHQESPEEVTAAVEGLKSMLEVPAPAEPAPVEPEPAAPEIPAEPESVVAEPETIETVVEPEAVAEPETVVEPEVDAEPEVVQEVEPAVEVKPARVREPLEPMTYDDMEEVDEMPAGPSPLRPVLIAVLVILVIAALALVAFAIVSRVCPEWIDSLLYSQEELEIIKNYL